MTCHSLRDAIVEQARGGIAGPGTSAAIDSHLEHCPSCAAVMTRERRLSEGLRALAAATAADVPSNALGQRLLEVFAERQAAARPAVVPGMNRWLGAAAAVLVVGTAAALWWSGRTPGMHGTQSPQVVAAAVKPGAVAEPGSSEAPVVAATPVAGGRAASAAPRSDGRQRAARQRTAAASREIRAVGFVAVPGADGLPDFESGQIIRLEIPLASLPTYGIEIQPDAQGAPVEADLLVGQDGQTRAIRLVGASASR